jgi:murein DD-endopeptidase MepM/ murein hydrolase activator NlpD
MPENAPSISQRYQPEEDTGKTHFGLDIIGNKGTPVIAAASGIVSRSENSIWGNTIVISHGTDNEGQQLYSEYAHLGERMANHGDSVERGQQIGTMGRSGILSGGLVHLHFSISRSPAGSSPGPGDDINPHLLWRDGPGKVSCYEAHQKITASPLRFTYPVPCREPAG